MKSFYSISVILTFLERIPSKSVAFKSIFSLLVFVSGQIVTIGNGMDDIGLSISVKLIIIGSSCQFIQVILMVVKQQYIVKQKAIECQNLVTKRRRDRNRKYIHKNCIFRQIFNMDLLFTTKKLHFTIENSIFGNIIVLFLRILTSYQTRLHILKSHFQYFFHF